jgi:hypothetical protein
MRKTFWRKDGLKVLFVLILSIVAIAFDSPCLGGKTAEEAKKTKKIIAGERYDASWIHELFLGADYRDLWTSSIEVEVLDLETFAGGLRPVMRVGRMQTLGLALRGEDGLSYTFRGIDKDPTSLLPPSFADTLAARIVQDQTAAAHPASPLIVDILAQAVGVLFKKSRLVVMPDDPKLGEFQADFAGALGTITEYPFVPSEGEQGTFGAVEILRSFDLWQRRMAGEGIKIDSQAYLRNRLLDIFIGDWDRHADQWRWANIPGKPGWQPIPEDRDQAFASYEGWVLTLARYSNPELVRFKDKYSGMEGLVWNGREVDRRVLTDLDRQVWMDIAADVQSRLTDAVIDKAVRRMPKEYYALNGEELSRRLKIRRDRFMRAAEDYYGHLAGVVDIHATEGNDVVKIQKYEDGGVVVQISMADASGSAEKLYYQRRFLPGETKEVRIDLYGGADRVESSGRADKRIKIRVIGEDGLKTIDDSQAGGMYYYGSSENTKITPGPGTKVDFRPYEEPVINVDNELLYSRDWGRRNNPNIWPGFSTDLGLFIGGGLYTERYGFRKFPYADSHLIRAGYATTAQTGRFEFEGDYRRVNSSLFTTISVYASGLDVLFFYGFGNETTSEESKEFYKVRQAQFSFFPALRYTFNPQFEIYGGPIIKYSLYKEREDTLIGQVKPYGADNIGQLGLKFGFRLDTRDPTYANSSGLGFNMESFFYPEVWHIESAFGGVGGDVSAYLHFAERFVLALRAGGKKVFGTFPFYEAAFLGGQGTIRGPRKERFAGDASLFGNAELRLTLGKAVFVVPGEYGIFGLADVGRVYFAGESSNRWHPAYGGGMFFSVMDLSTVFTIAVASSDERVGVYFKAGFWF